MKITPIQLAKRCERWSKTLAELGLAHWRIETVTLTDDMPTDGDGSGRANACVHVSELYDSYALHFRNEFLENADEREVDEAIVHELLHVCMRDLDEAASSAFDYMSAASRDEWGQRMHAARERMVENQARLIVRLHSGGKPRFSL